MTEVFYSVRLTVSEVFYAVKYKKEVFSTIFFFAHVIHYLSKVGDKMSIGKKIKQIRKEKGLTQKKLGELSGINEVQIRQYELERATPKIATIDKIANALNVSIIDIMGPFTIGQYKTTSEYKKVERLVSAQQGIIAILQDIYGKVEDKSPEGTYAEGHYYLIGEGNNQFVLYDGDIDTLYKAAKGSISFLVEILKDARPEKEILDNYMKDLNTPLPNMLDAQKWKKPETNRNADKDR